MAVSNEADPRPSLSRAVDGHGPAVEPQCRLRGVPHGTVVSARIRIDDRPASMPLLGLPDRRSRMKVAMLTPWDQECGNAEYAKRLVAGLEDFASVRPFDLRNFIESDQRIRRRDEQSYFLDLLHRVNACDAEVVHLQHEFCFFGRRIAGSNRRFAWFMRRLRKPSVVSLHTWLAGMGKRERTRLSSKLLESALHRLRNRHIASALHRADAIVLHSKDTYKHVVATFPKLKKRIHVVPIPIEPVACDGVAPRFCKGSRETWVMVPGFVSRYKGHGYVLEALKLLPESVKLVVAGGIHPKDRTGNDYWMDLVQRADACGLQSRVIFTGFLGDAAEQAATMRQADVFVLPYDEVGQSGSAVLADALSHDRPVITSRARSMFVYRMDRDTAFSSIAVDVGDAKNLADTILQCVRREDECFPESRRQRVVARERFSLANTRAAYERVYSSVLRPERSP